MWVFFANAPGFLLAAWFNLAASKLLFQQQFTRLSTTPAKEEEIASTSSDDSPVKRIEEPNTDYDNNRIVDDAETPTREPPASYRTPTHDYWVMVMLGFWMAVTATIGFGRDSLSNDTRQLIVGTVVNLNLVFFYGAPLSTIRTVLQTRNSASIHIPTMLTNTANGVFWTAYGFAVLDYFIFVPNGLGALLGFVQILLYLLFPRVQSTSTNEEVAASAVTLPNSDNLQLSVPFASGKESKEVESRA